MIETVIFYRLYCENVICTALELG